MIFEKLKAMAAEQLDVNPEKITMDSRLKEDLEAAESLTLDLKDLEYMSSAGLRVLLSAQKRMARKSGMKVTNVSETIMEIFEVTGFSDILTIE